MTIPANELVNVSPSVLSAGGAQLATTGLVLTANTRVPVGTAAAFPNGAAVTSFFGANSAESIIANGGVGKGSGYFGGFNGATQIPGSLLFTQYNQTAVSAYLRGGNISGLTLAQLQALSGSLTATMDGYANVIASISLASYNSQSAIAAAIQAAFTDPTEASFTASIGGHFGTCTSSGTTLTLGGVTDGYLAAGDLVSGTDTTNSLPAGCYIVKQLTGTAGGAAGATFQLSAAATPGNLTSCTVTGTSTVLDVTHVASGSLAIGQTVTGSTVASGTLITGQLTGSAGAVGTYSMSGAAQGVASESMTGVATAPLVTYDSVSGAFVITSGITGAPSSAAFATGTLSASLLLTSATGAVLSQGAAPAVPATFMNALLIVNASWTGFMTAFDPDGGSGNSVKQAFAAWKNSQNSRFCYVCWDTDATPTNTLPATSSLGYILNQNGDSGTALIWEGSDLNHAAFILGSIASINFNQTNGRISFAYKAQPGLVASVTDPTAGGNLAGNPQAVGSNGNGYNFVGAYGAANANFVWFQRGFCTGPFAWLDSYINQVWLNYGFQQALLALQQASNSVPYDTAGYTAIEAALGDQVQLGLNFGAFGPPAPGTLSQSQINAVNASAGKIIAPALVAQGYYLNIQPANPVVKAARTSPNITFFYIDNGSIQSLNLSSVALN
jgi:hypothetical protein